MNHYEKGRHIPDYTLLKRIGKVLRLPVAYFYAEHDELATLIKLFSKLKKTNRTIFLKKLGINSTE